MTATAHTEKTPPINPIGARRSPTPDHAQLQLGLLLDHRAAQVGHPPVAHPLVLLVPAVHSVPRHPNPSSHHPLSIIESSRRSPIKRKTDARQNPKRQDERPPKHTTKTTGKLQLTSDCRTISAGSVHAHGPCPAPDRAQCLSPHAASPSRLATARSSSTAGTTVAAGGHGQVRGPRPSPPPSLRLLPRVRLHQGQTTPASTQRSRRRCYRAATRPASPLPPPPRQTPRRMQRGR